MSKLVISLVILHYFFCTSESATIRNLSPNIPTCKRNSELNKCIVENGNTAIKNLANGDKKHKINSINPLVLTEATVEPPGGVKIVMKNLNVVGLDKFRLTSANINLDNNPYELKIQAETPIQLLGDYDVDGRILILPISGQGKCNITFENSKWDLDVQLKVVERDGVNFFDTKVVKSVFTAERIYFNFENLFNGNELLGTEMNKFLNENWKEVQQELGPAFGDVVGSIVESYVKQVFRDVPVDQILIP